MSHRFSSFLHLRMGRKKIVSPVLGGLLLLLCSFGVSSRVVEAAQTKRRIVAHRASAAEVRRYAKKRKAYCAKHVCEDLQLVSQMAQAQGIFRVEPVPSPTLAKASGEYGGDEGSPIALSISPAPPASLYSVLWDLNLDGNFETPGVSIVWTPPRGGIFFIPAKISRLKKQQSEIVTIRVAVRNRPPVVTLRSSASRIPAGQSVTFSASASDPGPEDTRVGLTFHWSFEDGSPGAIGNKLSSVSHTFKVPGVHLVYLLVTDSQGLSTGPLSTSVVVTGGAGGGGGGSTETPPVLDTSVLSQWQNNMTTFGLKHCAKLTSGSGTADELLAATYYDALLVFQQIAAYTGDPAWKNCLVAARRYYRDNYVVANQGRVPGYWNFTEGLVQDALRNGDSASRSAAVLLSEQAAYAADFSPLSWTVDSQLSREVAYTIESYLSTELLGRPRRVHLSAFVDQALGHIDQWFTTKNAPYVRPFMVGLTMRALIVYQEKYPDARITPALVLAADALWDRTWVASAQAFRYTDRLLSAGDMDPAPDLNLLIAPAYAWLYLKTGEPRFRNRGDQIFAGGVKGAYLGNPKQFNQNYRWSFDFIRWRK